MSRALTGAGESLRQAGHYAGWRQWERAGVSGFLEGCMGNIILDFEQEMRNAKTECEAHSFDRRVVA